MKRRPCWCPKPVLWELNSLLMPTLSFVPINLHRCWPRGWKRSIRHFHISHSYNPGQSPWDSTAIFIFFCHFSHPFRNFLAVFPPPTLHKVETRKEFWIHASKIVCGVRGGVGPVWIGKRRRNAKVCQDFCPWLQVPNFVFGIRDFPWLKAGIRD